MSGRLRGVAMVLGLLVLTSAAFFGARHWQRGAADFERLAPDAACDLRAGPCRHDVAGGVVELSVLPATIPLMQTLQLRVRLEGLTASQVAVEIRGLNMEMGLNRTRLEVAPDGNWRGETILPICSQRRMEWEAAVRIVGASRIEVPFVFATTRP